MSSAIVNLNVNPCKMCMPMGAVSSFYGIAGCMNLLHGSQGCSTYIRRHMATHYNEPVDIASSSLTEEGTVFGGEKNLIKGLDNLIKVYDPEVIGVSSTCLAETIGEDIPALVRRYLEKRPDCKAHIVTVPTPGYGGTQYEGWFRAMRALLGQTGMKGGKHAGLNVITGPVSPADARALKNFLRSTGLDCTLLPDISDNLDGGRAAVYARLPGKGTTLAQVERMAGARATLELSRFCPEGYSPGRLLEDEYRVPLIRLNLPIGLRDTDAFVRVLRDLGARIPEAVDEERGRCLDAMIDAHKYNAMGRAAIFGEPDLLYGLTRLCCENGLIPVVAACGGPCPNIKAALEEEIRPAAENVFVDRYCVLEEADFDAIDRAVSDNGANLLIGSSDGRRIAENRHLPLVRCAFPVHDHIGGQRIRVLGYSGAVDILERCANSLISETENSFRQDLFVRYFQDGQTSSSARTPETRLFASEAEEQSLAVAAVARRAARTPATDSEKHIQHDNTSKTASHPCFSCSAGDSSARIHLPVAPACNISCNYCRRDFDCPNESRPGVTTKVLSPQEALERFLTVKKRMPNLTVAGIAGPGDALANFAETAKTLRLIRAVDPDITFCLSTNGLMLPPHAAELIELGVSHVTITINSVDPAIGARICGYVDYLGERYKGETGAALLLANQLAGLKYLADHGVICKVNTVLIKDVNEGHVEDVVRRVKGLGAYIANIMQVIPVKGSVFAHMPLVSNKDLMRLRQRCEKHLLQMHHCRQCRADAVGLLGDDQSIMFRDDQPSLPGAKLDQTLKIAVASRSGVVVDQHFGHAEQFYIYESDGDLSRLVETRRIGRFNASCGMCGPRKNESPDPGRINEAINAVADCRGVLAMRIGASPSKRLEERGIAVFATYENIDKAVREAALSLRAI
jgi:nitrogenase molybdenum-iron protein alpha/beta subunit/MoaA/NifB/PqqE/SkfB family radical SAM enzyme